jgi:hypothetical protein
MLYQTAVQLSRPHFEHGPLALKWLFIILRTRTHSPYQTIFVLLIFVILQSFELATFDEGIAVFNCRHEL